MTRAFLLMNLEHPTTQHQRPLKFRVPIGLLGDSIPEIGGFPWSPEERTFDGPTLFIKGKKSKCAIAIDEFSSCRSGTEACCCRYINRHNVDTARAFFPNMILEELDAGHWGEFADRMVSPGPAADFIVAAPSTFGTACVNSHCFLASAADRRAIQTQRVQGPSLEFYQEQLITTIELSPHKSCYGL